MYIGDKYTSWRFVELVAALAAKELELLDGKVPWQKLPGLDVVSPLSIVFDLVSLGAALLSRRKTLQVIVVNSVSAETGYLIPLFLSCPSIQTSDIPSTLQTQSIQTELLHIVFMFTYARTPEKVLAGWSLSFQGCSG